MRTKYVNMIRFELGDSGRSMCIVAALALGSLIGAFPSVDVFAQAPIAASQPSGPVTAKSHPNNPEMWNAEVMIDEAVLQISRRYNLNEAQEGYTRLLLSQRVHEFLQNHEADVRTLLKESIDFRLGLRPADPVSLQDWATRAQPILEAAQKAILDGNKEWGVILDEKQKKIHDADLKLMDQNFAALGRTIALWQGGKGVLPGAGQAGKVQPPAIAKTDPKSVGPNAAAGPGGTVSMVSEPTAPILTQKLEDNWMAYVNKFIEVYQLDERMANSAREKIYKDANNQAIQHRQRKKADYEKLEQALSGETKGMSLAEIQKKKRELDRPLYSLFKYLDRKLGQLPDSKQRAGASEDGKKELEALRRKLSGEAGDEPIQVPQTSEPKPAGESRPAAEPKPPASAPADAASEPPKSEPVSEPKPAGDEKPRGELKPREDSNKPAPKPDKDSDKPSKD